MTQELTLITRATTLVVDSQESMIQAATLTGKIKEVIKLSEKKEKELLAILEKTEIAKEHAQVREIRLKLEKASKFVSNLVNKYQTAEARRANEEAARLAARVERGTMKLDTAVRKMDEIEKPLEKFETADGSVSFKTIPKLNIIDPTLIPREYMTMDLPRIFAALKEGIDVPGAQIIQVKSLNNR